MSEFNAALGLVQLKHIDEAIYLRRLIDQEYRNRLKNISGIKCIEIEASSCNYSYFPILVTLENCISRDGLYESLKELGINTRRYFYPLISNFPVYQNTPSATADNLPVANAMSNQIICLPIYPDLEINDVQKICSQIARYFNP
jgi:dTDP-4-amino-4,6-dideoxygalactose transaminase